MNPLHRILDANANRAREGLRVLEDIARFALDDAGLTQEAKSLRHEFVDAVSAVDAGLRLAARNTESDVGTRATTAGEYRRAGLGAVASAAAARAGEAMRAVEETLKGLGEPAAAERGERARYRLYTLEQRVVLALGAGRSVQRRLCVLVTESLCTHHPWERVVELAIRGGADSIQLREKSLPDRELLRRARRLVEIVVGGRSENTAARRGVEVVINDRVDVALLAGADGVHLGQADLSIADARALAGFRIAIGVSTSNLDQARAALRAGADSFGLGPMYPSTTKPKECIAGPEYVRAFVADGALAARPHLAISGITPERVPELIAAGCRGVAVSSWVCASPDPERAAREVGAFFA